MYTFRPYTDRIWEMREAVRDRVIRFDTERSLIMKDSYERNANVVPIIRHPLALLDMCSQMTVRVEDFEIIVGNLGQSFCGCGMNSDWKGAGWMAGEIDRGNWYKGSDGLYHNPDKDELRLTMTEEDYHIFRDLREYWKGKTKTATANAWLPDGAREFIALEASSYKPGGDIMGIPSGHLSPGYKKIINMGYAAIRKQAQDFIDAHIGDMMGDSMDKFMFYKSVTIVCDAASTMINRYADKCEEKAKDAKEGRKEELLKMADSMRWLAENPARTYWEACQGVIFYQLLLHIDAGYPCLAPGRFDQYTWPFLKKDLENGTITMDQAQEITDAFFLKLGCFYKGGASATLGTVGIGNTYQHTTIGGVDPKTGEDATNPVTYMVLETMGRLKLHDPTISLRINKNTPKELWECAVETSKLVGGLPLYQNDEVIIPGIIKEMGFTLEEARDYSFIGCQEIVGSGIEYSACCGVSGGVEKVHWGVALDMALNNGINPHNGKQASLHTGYLYDMKSFDEVKAAFEKMGEFLLKWLVSINNYADYLYGYLAPHAILSISIEGCMEKGMDCAAGGAKYNSYGGSAVGLATVADSLTAIKYMCFDKKLCTTKELFDAYMANWEGYDELRNQIAREVPHFGNDDPYADEQMTWVCDTYYNLCRKCYSKRAKYYRAGMFSAADHVVQGYHTWATPDGRLKGTPIADGSSPVQSKDKNGPTSVFKSASCYDHGKFMNGEALNLRFTPSSLKTDSDLEKLISLTKTYFGMGGIEVQYNITSTVDLKNAQINPRDYRDMVVRIAGYSAYFIELSPDCQNDVISRNENVL